jgi:hypothetical protein
VRALLLVLVLLAAPLGAAGERIANYRAKACGLTGTPSSVVVDVYVDTAPGSILATIPNAQVTRIGTLSCYMVDLATTTAPISYPTSADGLGKDYTLVFRDDAAHVVEVHAPVRGLVGPNAKDLSCEKETPVYASVPIPVLGITAQTIEQGKPWYIRVEVDCTRAFTSPPVTYYKVLKYNSLGRVESRTPSLTPPTP